MDDVLTALDEQQAELAGLLEGLSDGQWGAPSPCEGWSVADVVLHLAQTNEFSVASATSRLDELAGWASTDGGSTNVDDGAGALVELQRGGSGDDVRARWQRSVDELRDVLANSDPHARVPWVAGYISVHTLTTTRLAETWIHTNDVADGLGVTLVPRARLRHVARLAWRTLPYAFARDGRTLRGPVAFHLVGPDGDAWDFDPDEHAVTTITGDGVELCAVAARRRSPSSTSLVATGPDGEAVLDLVRTYA